MRKCHLKDGREILEISLENTTTASEGIIFDYLWIPKEIIDIIREYWLPRDIILELELLQGIKSKIPIFPKGEIKI